MIRQKQHQTVFQHMQVEKSALAEHVVSKGRVIDWSNTKAHQEDFHTNKNGSVASRVQMHLSHESVSSVFEMLDLMMRQRQKII